MTRKHVANMLLLVVGLLLPLYTAAQQTERYNIQGTVTESSGQPLSGAQVSIRGTRQGAITNPDGRYTIVAALPPGQYVLDASFIGRATSTRNLSLSAERNVAVPAIALAETAVELEGLVVTGPGAASERRALGNAVASVSGEAINRAPATSSVGVALQGKITGAVISAANGQPGGAVTIRLRGNNSILGTAEPLIVVDGVIVDNSTTALLGISSNADRGGSSMSNRLSDFSPDEVERIDVLKGASAAALYGSRAKNGVIQIFTKRGQQGVAQVSWGTEFELSRTPKTYDLNLSSVATVADISAIPEHIPADKRPKLGDPVQRFDVQDLLFRTGTGANTQLSVSGGSGGTSYFISGNYRNDQSIMHGSDAQRYSVRGKLTQQVGERLELTGTANFIKSHVDFVQEGEQGTGLLTGVIFTPTLYNPADRAFIELTGRYPYNPVQGINPLVALREWSAPEEVTRFVGAFDASYRPLDNVMLRYLFGIDDYRQESMLLQTPRSVGPNFTGSVQNPLRLSTSMNHDITAVHTTALGSSFELSSTFGIRYTNQVQDVVRAGASDLPPGQILVGGAIQSASQALTELRTLSWFTQEQFDIANRLFLTAGLNYEASSAFGTEVRWQLFPRIGASYLLNQEPFFQNSGLASTFSTLRLRAAYGETGGQPPGLYDRFDNYLGTSFGGKPGLVASTIAGNPNLKPERQREIESGFEVGVAHDRAVLEFTYYDQKTTDLVLNVPLASSSGYSFQRQNVGEVLNRGVEAALNTINYSSEKITWRSRLGFAANRNKVTKMATGADTITVGYLNIVTEGQPVGVFYGGVYARNPDGSHIMGNFTNANFPSQTLRFPLRLIDTLPNGATTFVNKVIGDPNPDWTASFTNTLEVGRNFDVSIMFDGRFGNDVANFTRRITEFFGTSKVLEKEANGDTVPMTYGRNPAGRINIYEEYIEDGSFIKLREVALRYRFDQRWVRRLGASRMDVSLAGRNLYTWTDYSGLDPEVNLFAASTVAQGVDFANTPLARTFVFGVNFTF